MSFDIFISYRRNDTRDQVSMIAETLSHEFLVFRDSNSIHYGEEWPKEIETALSSAKVVLVIIGKNWFEVGQYNKRRIDSEEDWVRKEILCALKQEKTIIPVLIDGMGMPVAEALPENICKLSERQAFKILMEDLNNSIEPLRKRIKNLLNSEKSNLLELDERIHPRYIRKKLLSEGSIASVYKVEDTVLERDVAIKVLDREDLQEYFDQSVRDAVKISDELYFISIYDVDLKRYPHYYIMQFIDGQSLRKLISNNEQGLPIEEVIEIVLKIGDALVRVIRNPRLEFTYAHIKPSNIMLLTVKHDKEYGYEPFISPLNLCQNFCAKKILEELECKSKDLEAQAYQEALAYQLPETFGMSRLESPSPEQSNQYMLGLLAYELLTGEIPSVLQDLEDLKQKGGKAFKQLTSITDKRPECPKILETVILRMTSLNPSRRYETLEAALDVLHNVSFDVKTDLNTVKESYERCVNTPNCDQEFFKAFYCNFLAKCPHAAKKFPSLEDEDNWKRQYQLLKEAVLLLFTYFEEDQRYCGHTEQQKLNVLTRIADTHHRHGIPAKFYEEFVHSLIETVTAFDPWSQTTDVHREIVEDAWKKVLKPGVEYMKEYA
ncbi:MAG: TIR domain-containing protein [Scytonema hyalinum WJT4-NPBG1]|jgi:serine/threonine protein kinase|nr:TIR domain-containing protein [Scytonema hyalinum WJT4-NPBG1]